MNEAESRSNFLGLFVLFAVVTIVGTVLGYVYIIFQVNIHDIWLNMIAVFVFGLFLALVVWLVKRLLKITNNVMSVVVVFIGLALAMYLMWGMWFALMYETLYRRVPEVGVFLSLGDVTRGARAIIMEPSQFLDDLLYYNRRGTWSVNDNQWTGLPLAFVWIMEVFVNVVPALLVASTAAGLYLIELNAWVKERLMNYGFTAFEAYELDQIAAGNIDVILEKPLEAHGGPMHAVAVCYLKGEPTEFIALYKADWDKEGALVKGRHVMTVRLGLEKIDALDAGLQAIHYPDVEDDDTALVEEIYEIDEIPPREAVNNKPIMAAEAVRPEAIALEPVVTNDGVSQAIDTSYISIPEDIPVSNSPGTADTNE